MFKISVIIPMYNDGKYIDNCIDHVINQTIGFENIQLIMVDDCSTDDSYKIAKKYEEKYPNNIVVRKLEKNSGAGGRPRNAGIDLAEGECLMFSDADDYFAIDAFETMYNAITEKKADFVISNWNYADEDGTPWAKPVFDPDRFSSFKLSIDDYTDSFWVMNSSMCNKIFNRKFIMENNIKCLEDVPGEDTYFSMNAFLNAKNVYYIDAITYFYRQRSNTNKAASTSWNCSKKFFDGMNVAYKATYELFVEKDQIQFYRFLYARNMTYLLYRFIDSTKLDDEERIELFDKLRWFYKLSKELKVPACQKSLTILIDDIIEGRYERANDICKIIAEMRTYMDSDVRYNMSKPYKEMYKEIIDNPIKKRGN